MGSSSKFTTLNSFVVKGPEKQMSMVQATAASPVVVPRTSEYPCLGITASRDAHVSKFITRTGTKGSGARSLTKIADQLFNKAYGELSERKKT